MSTVVERADALKTSMETTQSSSALAAKASASSKNNPTASSFNVWHANGDIGIGSDNPWGTNGKPTPASGGHGIESE